MSTRITQASDKAVALIAHFESFYDKAYLCSGGKWTIGYGTTRYPDDKPVRKGDKCTEVQAREYMKKDLVWACKSVDDATRDDISQSQFDALVSFAYNLGFGALPNSKLAKAINMRVDDPAQIIKLFGQWKNTTVNGRLVELGGLVRRRRAEAHLYLTGEVRFFEEMIK